MTLKIIFAPSKFDSSDKMANNDQIILLKRISQDEILHLSLPVIQRDFLAGNPGKRSTSASYQCIIS